MTVTQSNAAVKAANDMTSAAVNAAMYGFGLPASGGFVGQLNTFSDVINLYRGQVAAHYRLAADTTYTVVQQQDQLHSAHAMEAQIASLEAAYDNHTLVFQKASDAAGLGWKETLPIYGGKSPDRGATEIISGSFSCNTDFLDNNSDGKHCILFDTGSGLTMLATW